MAVEGDFRGTPSHPTTPPTFCSLVNELAFTARKMMAPEAQSSGLVRYCSPSIPPRPPRM